MSKDSYWFKHDSNARNDVKMVKLTRQLGVEGYGLYFMLIEVLREQIDYKLPLDVIPDLAFQFHISEEKVKAVVLGYSLFEIENETFFSARLNRQLEEYTERKQRLVEAGRKGGQARLKQGLSIGQADAKREEKRREDKRRVEESIQDAPPESTANPFFEFFRRVSGKHISDETLVSEIAKFQNKYPNANPNQSGALINTWVSNIGKFTDRKISKHKAGTNNPYF